MNLTLELRAYLDTLTITSDNIGQIRASCFVPWDSSWNGLVRDMTAMRETPYEPREFGDIEKLMFMGDNRDVLVPPAVAAAPIARNPIDSAAFFSCGCSKVVISGVRTLIRCENSQCVHLGRG